MQITTKFTPEVTRADALSFLGSALRNWDYVPPFTHDDADDVAGALASFLKLRGFPEVIEALASLVNCMPKDGGMVRFDGEELASARSALAKARGEV